MENIRAIATIPFEGKERPINPQAPIQLDGYRIWPFTFLDEAKERASGAFFDIDPSVHTAVAKVTEPGVALIEHAIKGSGWFLDIDPNDKITKKYLDEKTPLVLEYGTGHAFCFVASADGLLIQNVTTPPFRPEMEKIIVENSTELPKNFWQEFNQLRFTRYVETNPFGQKSAEIKKAPYPIVAAAIANAADLTQLGLRLDTSDPQIIKVWYIDTAKKPVPTLMQMKPKELIGRKIVSPVETLEDEVVVRFARCYLITDPSLDEVNRLVQSEIIKHPLMAWFLAKSASPGKSKTGLQISLNCMATKQQVLQWFELTKDRVKFPTIYDAADDPSLWENL